MHMKIHLFISNQFPTGNRLKAKLSAAMSACPMIHHPSIAAFERELLLAVSEPVVAVIAVSDRTELNRFVSSRISWERFKTILVLPETSSGTIDLGLPLRPVFIDYGGSGFNDVVTVLCHLRDRFSIPATGMDIMKKASSSEY